MRSGLANGLWVGLLVFLLGIPAGAARGEESAQAQAQVSVQAPVPPAEEEPDYTFGTVKSVTADQIVILEFDYDSEKEVEAAYGIDPKAELGDVASVSEIQPGDEVDIDYVARDGKKTAVGIFVSKPLGTEEEAAE